MGLCDDVYDHPNGAGVPPFLAQASRFFVCGYLFFFVKINTRWGLRHDKINIPVKVSAMVEDDPREGL